MILCSAAVLLSTGYPTQLAMPAQITPGDRARDRNFRQKGMLWIQSPVLSPSSSHPSRWYHFVIFVLLKSCKKMASQGSRSINLQISHRHRGIMAHHMIFTQAATTCCVKYLKWKPHWSKRSSFVQETKSCLQAKLSCTSFIYLTEENVLVDRCTLSSRNDTALPVNINTHCFWLRLDWHERASTG